MKHFPVFFDLKGERCLVFGTGAHAAAKARLLISAGADVEFVVCVDAEQPGEDAQSLVTQGQAVLTRISGEKLDFTGVRLVFAATGNREQDRQIAELSRMSSVPVNVVDDPEASDFITPAIVDRDPVTVAISTGGAAPVLARRIRASIETAIPERLGALAGIMARYRDVVRNKFPDGNKRRLFWERFLDGPGASAALAGNHAGAHRATIAQLNEVTDQNTMSTGRVTLVGAGPGAADLLTLRAARALQSADIIIYDRLVGREILDMARRDAERRFVGKAKGCAAATQDEINALLADEALTGKHVVRLKGGDPFLFGRGGEEMEYLAQLDIPVDVVPGITSAAGCAASAGIPLTHREFADGVAFVSAHPGDGKSDPDWGDLARSGRTIAIYMGVSRAADISAGLMTAGMTGDMPVAIVEKGTLPQERVVSGVLGGLADLVTDNGISSPALIIVGQVARFAQNHTDTEKRFELGLVRQPLAAQAAG